LCLQHSPLGLRWADHASAFPTGVNVAATFDRELAFARGQAIGRENRDKGVDVTLGPVAGPLGRQPAGGRIWEGFSPDPILTGVMFAQAIKGIQSTEVMTCAKHFIDNEQEHFRQSHESIDLHYQLINEALSFNIDDIIMHELYLWPFANGVRADVKSMMCVYQQVYNSYSCQNSHLMNYLC
jgi:beta-glucosidase